MATVSGRDDLNVERNGKEDEGELREEDENIGRRVWES